MVTLKGLIEDMEKHCIDNPNCHYKQLKRKEQECEELEQQYEILKKDMLNCTACRTTSTLKTQLDQLKAENEELKKDNAQLQMENERIRADLSNRNEPLEKLLYSQKQALDEIEKYTIKQFCDNCEEIGSTELTSHCEYCEYKEILDIITKAKEQ